MNISIVQAVCKRKIHIILMFLVIILYIVNKVIFIPNTTGIVAVFFQGYFNDLICPLFYLSYCQVWFIWIGHELETLGSIIVCGMLGGLIWEFVAPVINPKSVCDFYDLLCYFVGTLIYYFVVVECESCDKEADQCAQ